MNIFQVNDIFLPSDQISNEFQISFEVYNLHITHFFKKVPNFVLFSMKLLKFVKMELELSAGVLYSISQIQITYFVILNMKDFMHKLKPMRKCLLIEIDEILLLCLLQIMGIVV